MHGTRTIGVAIAMFLLAACGSEERSRRHAESLSQESAQQSTGDVTVDPEDPAAQSALASCDPAVLYVCYVEVAIISHTNAMRVAAGLAPYVYGAKLGFAARRWSLAQAEANAISHDGFPLAREASIAEAYGPDHGAKVLGENVAQNMMQQDAENTGRGLVTQWWNSPSHKQNLLGDFPSIGVGIGLHGSKVYATQLFGQDSTPD